MSKTEKRIIANVIAKLRGGQASDEVNAALTGVCQTYLEAWVIPPLETLTDDNRTKDDLKLADRLTN